MSTSFTRIPVCPHITSGGTPPVTLLERNTTARRSLLLALQDLKDAEPHRRDYPDGNHTPSRYIQARSEHLSRVDQLESILVELEYIQDHIGRYL